MVAGTERKYKRGMTMAEYTPWLKHVNASSSTHLIGDGLSDYVNREDVRAALHIPTTVPAFEQCSSKL